MKIDKVNDIGLTIVRYVFTPNAGNSNNVRNVNNTGNLNNNNANNSNGVAPVCEKR